MTWLLSDMAVGIVDGLLSMGLSGIVILSLGAAVLFVVRYQIKKIEEDRKELREKNNALEKKLDEAQHALLEERKKGSEALLAEREKRIDRERVALDQAHALGTKFADGMIKGYEVVDRVVNGDREEGSR